MALFKKRRSHDDYGDHVVLWDRGTVEGLWLPSREQAEDPTLIEALLARHGLQDKVPTSRYRIVPNAFSDRGGVLVRFVDDEPPVEQAGPKRELVVAGRRYPVHEDFEAFSRDAAAGSIALWKTTIAGLSFDDITRLYAVLRKAFGPDAPEARAVLKAPFQCLSCMQAYSPEVLSMRDMLREGSTITFSNSDPAVAARNQRVLEMTACIKCGGKDAVLIFDPHPPRRGD